jgi:hypothetical protein
MNQWQSICQSVLGDDIKWDADYGELECPGSHLHNTGNEGSKARLYITNDLAWIKCFHTACLPIRKSKSSELCRLIREAKMGGIDGLPKRYRRSREEIEAERAFAAERRQQMAWEHEARIVAQRLWAGQVPELPPSGEISNDAVEQQHQLLSLYQPDDIVWIGDKFDSNPDHFKPASQWLQLAVQPPNNLTCPSTFIPGAMARQNEQVAARRFLVVESDELDKDNIMKVFGWLVQEKNMVLQAIVDTGNKSLHGWFTFPDDKLLETLRWMLPKMKCDNSLFTASQPVRLPGILRGDTGRWQKLIWIRKQNGVCKHE